MALLRFGSSVPKVQVAKNLFPSFMLSCIVLRWCSSSCRSRHLPEDCSIQTQGTAKDKPTDAARGRLSTPVHREVSAIHCSLEPAAALAPKAGERPGCEILDDGFDATSWPQACDSPVSGHPRDAAATTSIEHSHAASDRCNAVQIEGESGS